MSSVATFSVLSQTAFTNSTCSDHTLRPTKCSGFVCTQFVAGSCRPLKAGISRLENSKRTTIRADYRDSRDRGGGAADFLAGFLLGGAVFGALGFVFSPQISKALLGEDADGSVRKIPRWMEEEDSLEATRKKMNEKIAELNMAIDSTSAQLRAEDRAVDPYQQEVADQTS